MRAHNRSIMDWTLHAGIRIKMLVLEAPDPANRTSDRGVGVLESADGIKVETKFRNDGQLQFILVLIRVDRGFLRHRSIWELAPCDGRQQQKCGERLHSTPLIRQKVLRLTSCHKATPESIGMVQVRHNLRSPALVESTSRLHLPVSSKRLSAVHRCERSIL